MNNIFKHFRAVLPHLNLKQMLLNDKKAPCDGIFTIEGDFRCWRVLIFTCQNLDMCFALQHSEKEMSNDFISFIALKA